MKTKTRFDCSQTAPRGGFTLIELMVVITIIAALLALTASATMKVLATSQANNTQTRLDAVQSQLSRAWSKVKDEAYKETIPPAIATWIQTNLAGSDANASGRTRVIYVKLKLRQAFPMNFNEALYPPTLPGNNVCPMAPLPGYVSFLGSLGITGTSGAAYESSACLLMALQRGASGAGINPEQIAGGGAISSITTPSGGSMPYLTDSWGRPIFFTRAPAGSLYLNPPTGTANVIPTPWWQLGPVTCYSQPGNNDPGDPQGYLVSTAWRTAFGLQFYSVTSEVVPLLPQAANTSFKLGPMVASGGPNNWIKSGGIPPLDPITFYTPPASGALFSTP
jgi:prepilin-type N-terminal cleavage/methylation domain-containing protein